MTLRTGTCRQRKVVDDAGELKRLYRMAEDDVAEFGDIMRDCVASLKLDRERAQTATRSHPDTGRPGYRNPPGNDRED